MISLILIISYVQRLDTTYYIRTIKLITYALSLYIIMYVVLYSLTFHTKYFIYLGMCITYYSFIHALRFTYFYTCHMYLLLMSYILHI